MLQQITKARQLLQAKVSGHTGTLGHQNGLAWGWSLWSEDPISQIHPDVLHCLTYMHNHD